jgi:hypothetical protein
VVDVGGARRKAAKNHLPKRRRHLQHSASGYVAFTPDAPAAEDVSTEEARTVSREASGWANSDAYAAFLATEPAVDPMVAEVLRSVAPGARPILDALTQKLDILARSGKLDERRALDLLARVAAF